MKFPSSFNLGTAFNLFVKKTQRIFIAPVQMFYRTIVRLMSPQSIVGRVSEDLRGEVKQITQKPTSLEEYYLIGNKYVAKKLVYVLALLTIVIAILFIKLGIPYIQAKFFTKTMVINSTDVQNYTGKVILINNEEDKLVLFVGRLEDGRINGPGTLYDYEGNLLYQGEF